MAYKVVVAPSVEPVSLIEAKTRLRIDGTEFDNDIPRQIKSARELAEHETGRAICTQTRELVLDAFPEAFVLRGSPVQSVVSVKFIDINGDEQTLDPSDTLLDKDSEPGYLVPAYGKTWPESFPVPNAVRVQYVCGYASDAEIPGSIKDWILYKVGTTLAITQTILSGNVTSLSFADRLLDPHRIYEVV